MKALVYGCKTSGKGAYKLLSSIGYEVKFVDDNSSIDELAGVELMVLSPGVPLDRELVKRAKSEGIEVIGEVELGYRHCKGDIVAVTGTNGKTTTCMMLDSILKESKIPHHTLGNIGRSFAGHVENVSTNDVVILETSSYQLETIEDFRPHIAVLTNLSVDHIERHGSFEDYVKTKLDIFANQTKHDIAVLNYDDERIRDVAKNIKSDIYYFSLKERVNGAYVKDKWCYFQDEKLFALKDIRITQNHNIANALAVIVVSKLLGVANIDILRALRNFSMPPHRMQFIGKYKGKNYYNDSKATNIDATISAVRSMNRSTTLIVGGYDKGISYHRLFESLDRNVKSVIIFGQNRRKVEDAIKDFDIRYFVVDTLLRAIKRASKERVENVLFSPATSSYDMFKNYEERGDMFIKLVGDINED